MTPTTPALRRTVRRLLAAPLFTLVALITLAVGIGANTAMFSVVYGVLLKPLPFPEPERLVGVWHHAPGMNIGLLNQGPATYLTYREEGRVFEDIGLWDNGSVSITGRGEPEKVRALMVTDGTLPVVGVQPHIGRRFTRADDTPPSHETVMLTFAYWQRTFGGNPSALGQTLMIEGRPREIIGVLSQDFRFLLSDPAVVLPMRFNRAEVFVGNFSYQGVARLKPGVTIEQANRDQARMIPLVIEKFPLPPGFTRKMFEEIRVSPCVRPLADDVIGDVGRVLWLLLGTVGLVLLIACANVANLFLVRAEGRQRELAIRAALGASWTRLARELLSESLALGLAGGALGAGLAWAALCALVALAPDGLPRLQDITIDGTVLAFTLGLSVLAGLVFGLIPVLRFARPRLSTALKEGGRGSSDGRERHRTRSVLVVSEIAFALVLLVGSGLMMRTFQALRQVNPGFVQPEDVLTMRVSIPDALVSDATQVASMHKAIADRLGQIPGVVSVGVGSSITMDGNGSNDPIFVEDFPGPEGRMPPIRRFKRLGGGYLEALGNHLIAGRAITWDDALTRRPVVMVSETLAREYWKRPAAAIGRRIKETPKSPWREIVGVVADERDDGVAHPATAIVYWPVLIADHWGEGLWVQRSMAYAIRSPRMGSPTFLKEVQQAVWAVNPNLPVANVRSLADIRAVSMAQTSFALIMLGLAAGVALLLGVVGIYGVIAYIASQRTREVGIRVALGAQPGDVRRLFVRHGLVLTGIGLVIGLGAAAAVTRVMASLLFGVNAIDPVTYAAVTGGLGAIALLASYLPARRAAKVDPVIVLRADA
jgi:predicted permease